MNTKYYREHQCTYNILVFTYLMMSKPIYLLMAWEKFNYLLALEQSKRYYRALQIYKMESKKKNSTVNLSALTILTKSSIWSGWLGPACASAGAYNTAFKIQAEIFLWQQVKMESFWSLGQLIV